MGKLHIGKYVWLWILGGEIAYTLCVLYAFFLSGPAAALHLGLLQLTPGFNAVNFTSWFLGAISVAIMSALAGAYIGWMHNSSVGK